MKTPDEILLRHFELAKKKYPDESWKKFDEVIIEREFVAAAMKEYAKQWVEYSHKMQLRPIEMIKQEIDAQ